MTRLGGDSPEAILATMQRAADWQLAHPSRHPKWDWTQAAFYTGMTALMDVTDEPRFEEAMRLMAEANQWRPGLRPGHADDWAVIATYARLAETDRTCEEPRPGAGALRLPHALPLLRVAALGQCHRDAGALLVRCPLHGPSPTRRHDKRHR